jgi:hypothetical protein
MNMDYSNGPNGWRQYPAAPANDYDSSDMYESDTNFNDMNDVHFDDADNEQINNALNATMADMQDSGLLPPNNAFTHQMGAANAAYLPAQPVPGPRPPPIEPVWNGQFWYHPMTQQQQQMAAQSAFGGSQYPPIMQPPNFGQMQQPNRQPAGPFNSQPVGNTVPDRQSKRKTAKTKTIGRPKKKGQPAKKTSLAETCICRKGIADHVKRPPNMWFLYKSHLNDDLKRRYKASKSDLDFSQFCSRCWKDEDEATRQKYQDWAAHLLEEHLKEHPGYKYTPLSKEAAKFGTDQCTCGAFEKNMAKLELEEPSTPRRRRQSRVDKSPEHEVNYGVASLARKRKASVQEALPTPKRVTRSSRAPQAPTMSSYEQPAQFDPMVHYGQQVPMPTEPQGLFSGGLFDNDVNMNQDPFGGNPYQDPFAANRDPDFGFNNNLTTPAFSTRSRSVVNNQDAADFQLDPELFEGGETEYNLGTSPLPDDFWDLPGADTSGGMATQQDDQVDDEMLDNPTPTRRSTRISAQKGNSAGSGSSPTTPTRRSMRNRQG